MSGVNATGSNNAAAYHVGHDYGHAPGNYNIALKNGQAHLPLNLKYIPPGERERVQNAVDIGAQKVLDLNTQIQQAIAKGDKVGANDLIVLRDEAVNNLTKLRHCVEQAGTISTGDLPKGWQDSRAMTGVNNVLRHMGIAAPDKSKNPVSPPPSPKASSGGSEAASSTSSSNLMDMSGGELRALMKSDPKKFAEMMDSASDNERLALTTNLQDYMQSMNRIETMISNMSKADHDTAKAIISNMRV